MEKDNKLYCDFCKRRIEMLTQEQALNDLPGHGWTDWKTAHKHSCMDCPDDLPEHNFPYETYFGQRIVSGEAGKRFMNSPLDGEECYSMSEHLEADELYPQ